MYLAQPLTLQLQPACAGTYLRWLSPLGEWLGWLFTGATDSKSEVTEATSIETADSRAAVAVRRAGVDTLTVRADNLTDEQWAALATILTSPQVYRQSADGTREPVLVAANASTTRSSFERRHTLEFDVRLPATNSLTH